jgi:hypothetical protein
MEWDSEDELLGRWREGEVAALYHSPALKFATSSLQITFGRKNLTSRVIDRGHFGLSLG